MFGRLAAVRIKAAEEALGRGRLEEALDLAGAPDLADQRPARELLARIGEALLERGQDHLLERRFQEALADFERAARCGRPAEKAAEWRNRALAALQDHQRAELDRRTALDVARQRLEAGSLTAAAEALALVPDDADRRRLDEEIARRQSKATEALAAAEAALQKGDLAEAARQLKTSSAMDARRPELADLEGRLITLAVRRATEEYTGGRLAHAQRTLALLGEIGRGRGDRHEIEEALRLAREAAKALADDRYAKAGVLLGRLTQIGPGAQWVSEVREHLRILENHRRVLLEGPLGLLLGHETPGDLSVYGPDETRPLGRIAKENAEPAHRYPVARHAGVAPLSPPVIAVAGGPDEGGRLPTRLLLRIDGVGSFLLLRGDRVTIGRAGPGATADLQLVSDLAERQAEIVRAGEDYFVVAASGVELADQRVTHALLQSGDRLRLGRRVRMTFLRPSRKSLAAALDLGDGVRTTGDCRRVILWSGPLLMGSQAECHIRLGYGLAGVILIERGGQILLKPMAPTAAAMPVRVGAPTEYGELRLTIQEWPGSGGVGRVVG